MEKLFKEIIRVNSLEHDVIYYTMKSFKMLRSIAQQFETKFAVAYPENIVGFTVNNSSEFVFEMTFGSDLIAFIAHNDVHAFAMSHEVMKSPYVKEDKNRAYCGIIDIYNFLSDSLKYKRMTDTGVLLGRVFVNKEGHFFVEGSREMGSIINRFHSEVFSDASAELILNASIEYALHCDIMIPPVNEVSNMTLEDFTSYRDNMQIKTGKKIGFGY